MGFGVLFLVILVLITVGCGRHIGWEWCGHGLTSRPRESSSEDFLNKLLVLLVIRIGLPLLYWLVTYLFGIVLPGLLGSCPLGGFLTGGRVCELVTEGVGGAPIIGSDGVGGDLFPPSVGRAGGSFENRVLGSFREVDSTEKHQHTLHELGTVRVLSLVPRFGRDCGFLGLIDVQLVILM